MKQPYMKELAIVKSSGGGDFPGPWLSATLLLIFGSVIAMMSLFLPPKGEIDGSVLMLFAQILVYAGSIYGVKIYIHDLVHQIRDVPAPHREEVSND